MDNSGQLEQALWKSSDTSSFLKISASRLPGMQFQHNYSSNRET